MSDPRDWGFEVRAIGEPPPEGLRVDWPPVPADLRAGLLESFRYRFTTAGGLPSDGAVKVPGYPPTVVRLEASDHTAGVVHLIRHVQSGENGPSDTPKLSAIGILLSGMNATADDRAILGARELVTSWRMRIELARFDEIVCGPRPLAVFVAGDAASFYDPTKQIIFSAFAQAFFDHIGARGPAHPASDPPTFGNDL